MGVEFGQIMLQLEDLRDSLGLMRPEAGAPDYMVEIYKSLFQEMCKDPAVSGEPLVETLKIAGRPKALELRTKAGQLALIARRAGSRIMIPGLGGYGTPGEEGGYGGRKVGEGS